MTKVLLSVANKIATITLNYAEKQNILNPEILATLSFIYQDCIRRSDVHIIVLQARGKHFCAGADLSHMLAMGNAPFEENFQDAKQLADFFYLIYSCKKPTIACAQGNVRGGGLGLCATHDIVIAEKNTTFSFTEVKLGLLSAVISPFVLQRISYQSAKYNMLTANVFSAEEALNMQLVDHVCDQDALFLRAEKIATELAEHPLTALEKTKCWLQQLRPITKEQIENAAKELATARSCTIAKSKMSQFLKH